MRSKYSIDGHLYVSPLSAAPSPPLHAGPYQTDAVVLRDVPSQALFGSELELYLEEAAQSAVAQFTFGREYGNILVQFQSDIGEWVG